MDYPGSCKSFVLTLLLLFGAVLYAVPSVSAEETLDIKRDKDKTVYSIGSAPEDKDEKADKDKAWEMLQNMPLTIETRGKDGGKGPDTRR